MSEEYTGGSVSYYRVHVSRPTSDDVQPYRAECNDIIEALGMNYAEGNAFKALWRRAAARNLGMAKKGYEDGLYDAEKVVFFGQRLVAQESALKAEALSAQRNIADEIAAGIDELAQKREGKPDWKDAPSWATHIVERLGVFEFAMKRDGEYWDGPDSDDGRFLFGGEALKCPWVIWEPRP